MRGIALFLICCISFVAHAQDTFQLAPPLLKYKSIFFTKKTLVELKFAQSNTNVYYTLNSKEPALSDLVYNKAVQIKKDFTIIKAKVMGEGLLPSETVSASFIKEGKSILSVEQTAPHARYSGSGVNTLIDLKGGLTQLYSKTWLGYNCDSVTILVNLHKKQTINKVLLNFLQSENAWVFLPDEIMVKWYNSNTGSYEVLANKKISADKENAGSQCVYHIIETITKVKTARILINIIVKKSIPEWHHAKGEHGWMFIDEIKVY